MSDDRPRDVLGALPSTRPHRRSQKRATLPTAAPAPTEAAATTRPERASAGSSAAPRPSRAAKSSRAASSSRAKRAPVTSRKTAPKANASQPRSGRLRQPDQPAGTPPPPRSRKTAPASGADIVGTAVQAAAELAEIGLSAGARALRSAVSRLPRP